MSAIVNAAPKVINNGFNDESIRTPVPVPEDRPTHLPLSFFYAQKGRTEPQLTVGSSRNLTYGDPTFDPTSPYFNHATLMNNVINSQGNSQMGVRIVPDDAGPAASVRLSLDILSTQVPEYQRNSDGSYTLDVDGLTIPTGTKVAGFKAKWVLTAVLPDVSGDDTFGLATQSAGDQTDSVTSTQSVRYPVMDLRVDSPGAYGSNIGLRMWAPTSGGNSPVDSRIIDEVKVYPFRIQCVQRADALSTPAVTETQAGDQYLDLSFKPNTLDRNTNELLYIGDRFIQAYQNLEDPSLPKQYGPYGELYTYDAQIKTILDLVAPVELAKAMPTSDLKGDDDENYRFNLVSAKDSSGVPYVTFLLQTDGDNAILLSSSATSYSVGGSDGTMNDDAFATSVSAWMQTFADPNSQMLDVARYPISIIYDSGFPLETKYDLLKIIAQRKDTFCVLAVKDVNGEVLTAAQENSLAIALKTRAENYPESEYYGTQVVRCLIMGRDGKMIGAQYNKRLPLTFQLARRCAAAWGASNSIWNATNMFDIAPLNEVDMFTDVNIRFTPVAQRNSDWSAGLNWAQSSGRETLFFPALHTVYSNDTSIFTSFITAMACVELQKVGEASWRQFTGRSDLTDEQFAQRIDEWISNNVRGRLTNRYTIVPRTYYTASDTANGFSWHTEINLYGPNMKTVATLNINGRRISDLDSANP